MNYWDTSLLIKLYVKEPDSNLVEKKVKAANQAIPLVALHDLEFNNALNLKHFRGEIARQDLHYIQEKFKVHEQAGIYYRPATDWSQIFQTAFILSNAHTIQIGCRSLDILHVAAALMIKASLFFTNDERQRKLATRSGLKAERLDGE